MDTYTTENLFEGALTIRQKRKGYRFTIDPVLLAHFVRPGANDKVVDLGTGSGIIPLILSHRYSELTVTGLEIQESLAELAKENISVNGLSNKITLIHCDMTDPKVLSRLAQTNLVVANPPYTRHIAGRINPIQEKALARHEITITLPQLILTASDILEPGGCFALIFPHDRLSELLLVLGDENFEPNRMRVVHPKKDGPPRRVLIESVKCGIKGCVIEPPLFIFEDHGVYSDEVAGMFAG
ncbi:MAG: methyltransferase [Desulfobacteraceae bacterium]|jgi:tRNA1Val (adenine37-N6)-methyltransferase